MFKENFNILFISVIIGILILVNGCTQENNSPENSIPAEFSSLYSFLESTLNTFKSNLNQEWDGAKYYNFIPGVQLAVANANRGEALLTESAKIGNLLFLDRFVELGIKGVTVNIGYPILLPDFSNSSQYLEFYKWLANEIRKRGIKLIVESGIIFRESEYSSLNIGVYYDNLADWNHYFWGRRIMAHTIVSEIKPDFLSIGNEQSVEEGIIGLPNPSGLSEPYFTPYIYSEYIKYVLDGLDKNGVLLGAGSGTWDDPEFVKAFVKIKELDYIDLHVYPITHDCLERGVELAEIAKENGKMVISTECWLYKATSQEVEAGGVTRLNIFSRDVFDFWIPLDEKFHEVFVLLAHAKQFEYIAPFWIRHYFAYLKYDDSTKNLPAGELFTLADEKACDNIIKGIFSKTALTYKDLIAE
jgi:hypothetical protein